MSGLPTLKAACTDGGAAGAAEVAHLLRPLVLDILKERARGHTYRFSDDDLVLCLMSFSKRAFLRIDNDGKASKFSSYNATNAGWGMLCWAMMTGRGTMPQLGRGTFLLAMDGQSETNRRELAAAGINNSDDFNIAYDRWNRIKPPCWTLPE